MRRLPKELVDRAAKGVPPEEFADFMKEVVAHSMQSRAGYIPKRDKTQMYKIVQEGQRRLLFILELPYRLKLSALGLYHPQLRDTLMRLHRMIYDNHSPRKIPIYFAEAFIEPHPEVYAHQFTDAMQIDPQTGVILDYDMAWSDVEKAKYFLARKDNNRRDAGRRLVSESDLRKHEYLKWITGRRD